MNALLLRAADARWLRYGVLVLLWSAMAIAERAIQLPSGMRFPGLLLLAVTLSAWLGGRAAAAAAIAASLVFAWLSMRSDPMPDDAERFLVFAVVAAIAATLAASLRELRQERNALRAQLASRDVREERANARDRLAVSSVASARTAEHDARAARDELAAAHGPFAAFMAAFPYPAFIQDEHGRFVFMNDAARASRAWQETMGTRGGAVRDERRYFSIRFPLDVGGRTWLGGIAIDISERTRAERALRGYEAELEREVRRRDEFLAVLAHELRNPLAPVQHSVQILHRAPHDLERVRRATRTIDKQVAVMERLIDDLLDVARISQGLVELAPQPCPLESIVDGALDVVSPVAERSGHRFEVRHADAQARAFVDAFRAEQVVVNLLSNAVKYSPPGSKVRIGTGVEDGLCWVAVADEGQGILPEHLDEIFTMFARPGIGQRPKQSGMGVGLALAKQLAEQQGGRIEACSDGPGCGATFTAWFPRSRD